MFSRRWAFRVFGFWVGKTLITCGLANIFIPRATSNTGKKPVAFSILKEKSEAEILLFQFCHFIGTAKSQKKGHSLARNDALLDNQSWSSLIPSRKRLQYDYILFHIHAAVDGCVGSRSAYKMFVCVFFIIFTTDINYLKTKSLSLVKMISNMHYIECKLRSHFFIT